MLLVRNLKSRNWLVYINRRLAYISSRLVYISSRLVGCINYQVIYIMCDLYI